MPNLNNTCNSTKDMSTPSIVPNKQNAGRVKQYIQPTSVFAPGGPHAGFSRAKVNHCPSLYSM